MRPTRQSLTERNGIPERNTEKRDEIKATRDSVAYLVFHIMCSTSRPVFPCFAPASHALGFKIAAAALRPRNDKIDPYSQRFCTLNR